MEAINILLLRSQGGKSKSAMAVEQKQAGRAKAKAVEQVSWIP